MRIEVRIDRCILDRPPAPGIDPSPIQAAVAGELVRLFQTGGPSSHLDRANQDRGDGPAGHDPQTLGRAIALALYRSIRTRFKP